MQIPRPRHLGSKHGSEITFRKPHYRAVIQHAGRMGQRAKGDKVDARPRDVDQVVVKRRPAPDVGERLRRRLIRVRAVRGQAAPPDGWGGDDAGADTVGDDGIGGEGAAVV